jgi:imidazolonepropionase
MSGRGLASRRVVTCDPALGAPLGIIENGAVVMEGRHVTYVGDRARAPRDAEIIDLGDRLITPGLVDAHTHACWVGSRHDEFAARLGAKEGQPAAAPNGGILATQRAVAAASEDDLLHALAGRLRRMAALGVTTVEVKSGYGLDGAQEHKQLAAIARVRARTDLPSVVPTLLALHAVPEADRADRAAYVARVATELVPAVARARLAQFVDAYVDEGAFTVDEARAVGQAARTAGLGVRLHVGQFADVGGAELAASLGAFSADHLEHVSPAGLRAMAAAGVSAVLLPMASFILGQRPPPVDAMRAAGVTLVLASDANPGTAPTESLPLAMAIGARTYGLTAEEALLATTRSAARSLGLGDRGMLRVGARADVVAWDLPHERSLIQPWGIAKAHAVFVAGREWRAGG